MNPRKRIHVLALKKFLASATLTLCLASSAVSSDCVKSGPTNAAETAAILAAAQPKFEALLDEAQTAKPSFGFEANDDLHRAVMGDPVPVYTVSEKSACDFCSGDKVESVLKKSGQWLIPVTINGALRTFIKISQISDNGTNNYIAQLGSATVARVWQTILDRWPLQKNFHPKLVTHSNIPGYYFTIPEINPQNMTDIVCILSEVDKPAVLSPASVIIHSWQ